jgi:hypothetical protein
MTSNSPDCEGKKTLTMDLDSPTRSTSDDQFLPPEKVQEKQNSIQALLGGNDPEYATGFTAVSHHIHHPHRPGIQYHRYRIPGITDKCHRVDDVGRYYRQPHFWDPLRGPAQNSSGIAW